MRRAWLIIGLICCSVWAQTAPGGLHVYRPRLDWETPSWGDFIARSAEESAYPGLWPRWAWLMSMGPTGLRLHPISGGVGGAVSPGLSWVHNALVYPGDDSFVTLDSRISLGGAFTLLARSNIELGSYYGAICGGSESSQWRKNANSSSDGPMRIYCGGAGAGASTTVIPSSTIVDIAVTRDPNDNRINYFYNGRPDGDGGTYTTGPFVIDYIGNAHYVNERDWMGSIFHLFVYDKALSLSQIAQLHADPYCWLRLRQRILPKATAAAGPILLSPDNAQAIATAQPPSVIQGSLALSASQANAAGSALSPSVVLGSLAFSPGSAAAQVLAQIVGIIQSSLAIAPAAGSSGASAVAPSVIQGSLSLSPGIAEAIVSAIDPMVSAGALILSPAEASISGQAISPTVILGSVTVPPGSIEAATSALAPAVVQGSVAIAPDVAQAAASAENPLVSVGAVLIVPGIAEASGTVQSPVVVLGSVLVTPAVAEALAACPNPVVVLGSTSVSPAVAAAIAAAIDPTVFLGTLPDLIVIADLNLVQPIRFGTLSLEGPINFGDFDLEQPVNFSDIEVMPS